MTQVVDAPRPGRPRVALPTERLRQLEGWAMVSRSMCFVYRPTSVLDVKEVIDLARRTGRTVAPRGSGFSYGDAALNAENIVLDLSRMNRVLDWNPGTGTVRIEPGVTIGQLWRYVLEDGWWPAVVPGTMHPTLGGCLSTNIHGKNNWIVGTIGDWVVDFTLLSPSGDTLVCSPADNPEVFRAVIGGLGVLGVIVELTLKLTPVTSGLLKVQQLAVPSLDSMMRVFEDHESTSDYLVGWLDAFAERRSLGRGLVQVATHVWDDPAPSVTLRPETQDLPDTIFGLLPRSKLWIGMKPSVNDIGMHVLNTARYVSGAARSGRIDLVPHARFHFFHDYVPDWKRSFRPGGIVEFQVFVPYHSAMTVFKTLLIESRKSGHVPYLTVFKRHRPDSFMLSYNVDGYSLSLDYRATASSLPGLRRLLLRLTDDVVLPMGGRFYLAKDMVLHARHAREMFGQDVMEAFVGVKRCLDSEGVLQTDLYRRLFT